MPISGMYKYGIKELIFTNLSSWSLSAEPRWWYPCQNGNNNRI